MSVACMRGCGQLKPLDHLLECKGLSIPDQEEEGENRLRFLCQMARRASDGALPIPIPHEKTARQMADEISLLDAEERISL